MKTQVGDYVLRCRYDSQGKPRLNPALCRVAKIPNKHCVLVYAPGVSEPILCRSWIRYKDLPSPYERQKFRDQAAAQEQREAETQKQRARDAILKSLPRKGTICPGTIFLNLRSRGVDIPPSVLVSVTWALVAEGKVNLNKRFELSRVTRKNPSTYVEY